MNNKNRYSAFLLKKTVFDAENGIFTYQIVDIMENGYLDVDSHEFINSKTGNSYLSMDDEEFVFSAEEYCYGFPFTNEKLKESYLDLKTEEMRILEYFQDVNQYLYFNAFEDDRIVIKCVKKEDIMCNNEEKQQYKNKKVITKESLSLKEMYEEIKKRVIGQDETIRKVLSAIDVDSYAKDPSEKKRCLIVGKTGQGKTEIIRNIGKLTNRPFIKTDSTQITIAGYQGGKLEENILIPLLMMTDGDVEAAENGIVALDEIDKKGSSSNYDVAGRGVLNSLLSFLEGTFYPLTYKGKSIMFDTSKLSILVSGAFTNIFDYYAKKNRRLIGYRTPEKAESNLLDRTQITAEDLIKIGLMPAEFIGRFPIIAQMNELDIPDFEKFLKTSLNSPLLFYYNFFKDRYNVLLKYENAVIHEIAQKGHAKNLGVRAMASVVEEVLEYAKWNVQTHPKVGYKELILQNGITEDPKKYILR